MNPKEIPSVMLVVKGIITNVKKAGMACRGSAQSIRPMLCIMNTPIMMSTAAMPTYPSTLMALAMRLSQGVS